MKTLILTAVGAVMLASGGMYITNGDHTEASGQKVVVSSHQGYQENTVADVTKLPEYATLATKIDVSTYSTQVVEDNISKRILVFKDDNGQHQYKTIYVKKTGLVKMIKL